MKLAAHDLQSPISPEFAGAFAVPRPTSQAVTEVPRGIPAAPTSLP